MIKEMYQEYEHKMKKTVEVVIRRLWRRPRRPRQRLRAG